jgi:hypothetical protein
VANGRHSDAIHFLSLGSLATLAHPTYDNFLAFLYSLGPSPRTAAWPSHSGCRSHAVRLIRQLFDPASEPRLWAGRSPRL